MAKIDFMWAIQEMYADGGDCYLYALLMQNVTQSIDSSISFHYTVDGDTSQIIDAWFDVGEKEFPQAMSVILDIEKIARKMHNDMRLNVANHATIQSAQ